MAAVLFAGAGIEKNPGGAGGGGHFDGGALAHAFRLAIAPDVGWQNSLVPFVDQIADRLADEMAGNGVAGEAVFGEQGPFLFGVFGFSEGAIHLEMIAPAGEFHAVITHFFDEREQFGERKIGPLAGEKSNGSWHGALGLKC